MFGAMLGPQDISFDSMARHHQAVGDIVRAQPGRAGRRCVRSGHRAAEPGIRVRPHEAARPSAPSRWTRSSRTCAPKWPPSRASSRSCRTRRPSPSAARTRHQRLPAHAAERQPERDLHLGAAADGQDAAAARLRGRQHRHADLQPAGDGGYRPRPRAVARRHAAAGAGRAVQRLQPARGVGDLRARQPVLGDPRSAARNTSARPMRCRSCTCARRSGSLVPLDSRGAHAAGRPVRCSINHFGQLPAVTISFNLRPGLLAGPGGAGRWTTPSATCACRPPSAPASRAR